MKAIILAAGFGNRMKPLTNNLHKTLLKINDTTIIDNIVKSLLDNGVNQIIVVIGYRADELKEYLLKTFPDKVDFVFVNNPIYRKTNNIYSLALAFEQIKIDDDIILIESDLFYKHNVIRTLINSKYENVALVDKYRTGLDGTVVKISDNKIIQEVIPPHLQGSDFNFSDKYKTLNIYKFSKSFCKETFSKLLTYYAKVINNNCYYELILGILIYMQQDNIYAETIDKNDWVEVDDVNDMRIAEYQFNVKERKEILAKSWGGYWNYEIIDFAFIRNMYFPTSSMIAEVKNNFEKLIHNYGSSNNIVNEKLSYFLLKSKERIVALNGAAQIYPILGNYFKNKKVLLPNPTFGEYNRVFNNREYYNDNLGFVDMEIISQKAKKVDVIVFVNPNNPTGSFIGSEKLIAFAKSLPEKLIIIDESFIDFAEDKSATTILENETIENILIIKSMSKSHGFPGIRLGYVYSANYRLIRHIKNNLPIWNFNSFAEFFLEIMLKHRKSFEESISQTILDRELFIKKLNTCSWIKKVYPSKANFILVETNPKINSIVDKLLLNDNIYIREVSNKFNTGKTYFRFAVRLKSENDLLINKLSNYYELIKE